MKGAALRRRIEQGGHLLAELFLLESMPVDMRLESVTPGGRALLRAPGPVGPQFSRRRNRMRYLAVDRRVQSLADALIPQHARAGAVRYQDPRHLFLHRLISLAARPLATAERDAVIPVTRKVPSLKSTLSNHVTLSVLCSSAPMPLRTLPFGIDLGFDRTM